MFLSFLCILYVNNKCVNYTTQVFCNVNVQNTCVCMSKLHMFNSLAFGSGFPYGSNQMEMRGRVICAGRPLKQPFENLKWMDEDSPCGGEDEVIAERPKYNATDSTFEMSGTYSDGWRAFNECVNTHLE